MPRISRYIKPRWLKREDIDKMSDKQRVITIDHISVVKIEREDRLVLQSGQLPYPLPLNNTNILTLAEICNSEDTDDWRGQKAELYIDETVMMGQDVVGGVRFRAVK